MKHFVKHVAVLVSVSRTSPNYVTLMFLRRIPAWILAVRQKSGVMTISVAAWTACLGEAFVLIVRDLNVSVEIVTVLATAACRNAKL